MGMFFRNGRSAELARLLLSQQYDEQMGLVETPEFERNVEFCTLEEAGLEESGSEPVFGRDGQEGLEGGVIEVVDWFYDGECPRWNA